MTMQQNTDHIQTTHIELGDIGRDPSRLLAST